MQTAHVYFSGFVQGVGFRKFIKKTAERLQITGWVRNLSDDRVEAVLQGEKVAIFQLLEACHKKHMYSDIKDITIEWEEQEPFSLFKIIH